MYGRLCGADSSFALAALTVAQDLRVCIPPCSLWFEVIAPVTFP